MPELFEKSKRRESGVTRVVGVDPDTEKAILEFFGGRFSLKEKLPFEKEKSAELSQMISQISDYMKEFAARYGAKSLDIPSENIHILDETKMSSERKEMVLRKLGKVMSVFSFGEQHIFILNIPSRASDPSGLAELISHEMLHNISFQSAELKPDQDNKARGIKITGRREDGNVQKFTILPRRMGFKIMKNKEDKEGKKENEEVTYFYFLDEAIIAELTMRFDWWYFPKIPLIMGDVISAQVGPREYKQEREKLNKLIDELYEGNRDRFNNREEVFDVFARAVMTGRLSPVARLIEKTFGKGSFRELGEDSGKGFDKKKK